MPFKYSLIPDGQEAYVSYTGSVNFETGILDNPTVFPSGFHYTPASPYEKYGKLTYTGDESKGWLACPNLDEGPGKYEIFADVPGFEGLPPDKNGTTCIAFDALTLPAKAPGAYQYQ